MLLSLMIIQQQLLLVLLLSVLLILLCLLFIFESYLTSLAVFAGTLASTTFVIFGLKLAGMEFDVKGGLLTIDARYSWSLATITTSGDKRNRVLAAVIGFAFK